mmetsp:Transcript_14114/g.48929  ORF Transcript_14114/g.48929 Transcript_14114/m.48929 type:complete len:253 (+) Transcript_14114:482-1240(+)
MLPCSARPWKRSGAETLDVANDQTKFAISCGFRVSTCFEAAFAAASKNAGAVPAATLAMPQHAAAISRDSHAASSPMMLDVAFWTRRWCSAAQTGLNVSLISPRRCSALARLTAENLCPFASKSVSTDAADSLSASCLFSAAASACTTLGRSLGTCAFLGPGCFFGGATRTSISRPPTFAPSRARRTASVSVVRMVRFAQPLDLPLRGSLVMKIDRTSQEDAKTRRTCSTVALCGRLRTRSTTSPMTPGADR